MELRHAALIAIGLLAGPAWAKPKPTPRPTKPTKPTKPSDAQAKKAVADWIVAMHFATTTKLDAALALTAVPFHAAAYDDEGTKCPDTDAAAKTLACLQLTIAPAGKPKVWTHKSSQNLGGPIAAQAKRIDELRKTAAIVEHDEGCDGTENDVIVAVTKDSKLGIRIAAVFAQTVTCTE